MNNLSRNTKLFAKQHSSTILTCIGAAGVIATSVTAVKATPKAMLLLQEAEKEKGENLTKMEAVKVAAPAYIPSIVIGVSTIACIFGANVLNKQRQAALMSAYAMLDSSYKGYKKKVEELYGEEASVEVRGEIAKDAYEEDETSIEEGKQLFFDYYSMRYFESTIEEVQRAEYRINRNLVMRDYAFLNEFYEELGLPPLESGEALGWSMGACMDRYWQSWIDFTHEKVVMEDGLECLVIVMQCEPIPDFADYS